MAEKVVIGNAELWHGDCREVLPLLPAHDLLLTDPPYGIADIGGKWGKKAELHWDKAPADNEVQFLAAGRAQIVWGGNYFRLPPSRGWLAWRKPDRVPSAADFELAWTSMDMNARLIDQTIAATNAERVGHPTQKPLRVMAWSLSFAPDAQTVLRPIHGQRNNRRCLRPAWQGVHRHRTRAQVFRHRLRTDQPRSGAGHATTARTPARMRAGGAVVKPNVRANREPAAGRQAWAGENVPCTARPGLVACRWRSG